MKTKKLTQWSVMMLLAGLLLGLTALVAAHDPTSIDEELVIWAASLPEDAYHPGTYAAGLYTDPTQALGEADELAGGVRVVSLGNALADMADPPLLPMQCEAYLLLAYDQSFTNGPDYDLVVFEAAAGGVEEATWVYVGRDDDLWLYAGEAGGGDGGAVDIAGAVQQGELFNRVALCDKPDGITSGSPVGGPDIDAVAALHPVIAPDYVVRANGQGVYVNEVPVPSGAVSEALKPADEITLEAGSSAEILCDDGLLQALVVGLILHAISGQLHGDGNILVNAIDKLPNCINFYRPSISPAVDLLLVEGEFLITKPDSSFIVLMSAPLAEVSALGPVTFGLAHEIATNESTILSYNRQLTVSPADTASQPFILGPAQRVTLTAAGVGPVEDLDQVALPVVVGAGE